ncbi:MAG: hypothetical protein KCHDKBKB_02738 [Elusimicrobia bacterium]|nr:hypothetical protein [Elusimicrobiota bacterium]
MNLILDSLAWVYVAVILLLMAYGIHRLWILILYWRYHKNPGRSHVRPLLPKAWRPSVTIQLPLFNERYVAERLIDSVVRFDYPKDRLEIQVLDDSTDDTPAIVSGKIQALREKGYDIKHLQRSHREGFKAGALAWGLAQSKGEFIAIFDADFLPPSDFLAATLPHFLDYRVGMVQTRWGYTNADYSLLTRLQAVFLDGHFQLEHTARYKSGAFFNFNGTAGIWRKETIVDAGGWSARTLTEDLDLSYRAQIRGWRFVYDSDFVCPSELPVDLHAFESQQKRWTKGAIQVARQMLKDIWKSSIPLHNKVEATFHLTANGGYPLTVLSALLILPSLFFRPFVPWPMAALEWTVFFFSFFSIGLFYAVTLRELYPDWKRRVRYIPGLMSFGIGMCLVNTQAVIEGWMGKSSEFVRTPKYNIQSPADSWKMKTYAAELTNVKWTPLFFSVYALLTWIVAIKAGHWSLIPTVSLFFLGFSYVATLSFQYRNRH